jgi:hypothetical protein
MPFSEVQICNMALARLGKTTQFTEGLGTVASLDPTEANEKIAAEMCQLWYETVRDAVGRDFGYGTTSKYALLVLANNGDGEVWEDLWENAWAYPGDALFIRGFVAPPLGLLTSSWPETATNFLGWPLVTGVKWAIGTISGSAVIFANGVDEDNPLVEYTMKQATAASNFVDVALALSWRLAAELCLPLLGAEGGSRFRDFCERNYAIAIDVARRTAANEAEPYDVGDGRWMASRNG